MNVVLVMLKKERTLKHRFPTRNKHGVDFFCLFGFWFCFLQFNWQESRTVLGWFHCFRQGALKVMALAAH